MFFSTEVTTTFNSMKDVLKAYPKWKLNIRNGTQALFHSMAEDGDKDYTKFWNRLQKYPKQTIFNSIDEGYNNIVEDQIMAHLNERDLRYYMKNNPTKPKPKTIPVVPKSFIENMIVTENSPLGPMLRFGCESLIERGVIDILQRKWTGESTSSLRQRENASSKILSIGQLLMVFVLLIVGITISFIIFIAELKLFAKRIQN